MGRSQILQCGLTSLKPWALCLAACKPEAYAYNLSAWEVEAGAPEAQGHPQLHSELETSLGYMRPRHNTMQYNTIQNSILLTPLLWQQT